MNPNVRLRLATRMHFALLRHYGENVSVSTLLKGQADAREALWVCEASGHDELVTLAQQFSASAQQPAVAPVETTAAATPQDLAWSQDTSGFGISRPADLPEPQTTSWLKPSSWLGRSTARPYR